MEATKPPTKALPQFEDPGPLVLRRGGQQALERVVFEIQRVGQIFLDLSARAWVEVKQSRRSNAERLARSWAQLLQRLKTLLLEDLFSDPVSSAIPSETKG